MERVRAIKLRRHTRVAIPIRFIRGTRIAVGNLVLESISQQHVESTTATKNVAEN